MQLLYQHFICKGIGAESFQHWVDRSLQMCFHQKQHATYNSFCPPYFFDTLTIAEFHVICSGTEKSLAISIRGCHKFMLDTLSLV